MEGRVGVVKVWKCCHLETWVPLDSSGCQVSSDCPPSPTVTSWSVHIHKYQHQPQKGKVINKTGLKAQLGKYALDPSMLSFLCKYVSNRVPDNKFTPAA